MEITLATWNMAYWNHKKLLKDAWHYYINTINPDILLFQESYPDYEQLDNKNIIWNEIGDSRPWGSGIYCPKYKIKEFPFANNFHGSVTATEIEIKSELKLIVISLYGKMENILNDSYAIPNLHRIFSDLTGILEGGKTKKRVIIGGDFNASTQLDEIQNNKSHKVFFDRLTEFGLINCYDDYYSDYIQTHRHHRSKKPWQNDYFFISKALKNNLKECKVLQNDKLNQLSDHNPVIIKMEF